MKQCFAVLVLVLLATIPASAADVFSTGFDAGYAVAPLWGQPAGSSSPWDSSVYSSNPAGTGDTWLSNPNVVADPANAANQVAEFYGDCSGGAVHGAAASVVVSANDSQDITFTQTAYYSSARTGTQSLCISALCANGGCQWGGNQNFTFGTYGYFVQRYDQATADAIAAGMVAWSLWNSDQGNYQSLMVPNNTWTTASVTFHQTTLTADLSVTANNVTQQILGIPSPYIAGCVIGGQTRYDMYTDGDTDVAGSIYLDNVRISQGALAIVAHDGDSNNDGKVDVVDLGVLAKNYGSKGLPTSSADPYGAGSWQLGDFSSDGNVDVVDLGVLAKNYGWLGAPATAAVPEPATMSLLVLGGLAMLRRNKK